MPDAAAAWPCVVVHVDMDAFYASVELVERPELRSLPLIVGADPKEGKGRGVVVAASYESRKFGVRSAMPISRAWALCPTGIYVRPRFDLYEEYSRRIMRALRPFASTRPGATDPEDEGSRLFEPLSIDEAVMECTGRMREAGSPQALALAIQEAVRAAAGVSCSVGIATGKVTAKIASEARKPGGVTVVDPGTGREFLSPLPVSRIPGIGPKTTKRLKEAGIDSIGQFAVMDAARARRVLGSSLPWFIRIARGEDDSLPAPGWEAKSLSEESTFPEDVEDRELVRREIDGMATRLAASLRSRGLVARNVTLKLRFEGFDTHTSSRSIPSPTRDEVSIAKVAGDLLRRFSSDERRVRLVGLRVGELSRVRDEETLERWKGEAGESMVGTRKMKDYWRF